MTAQTFLDGRVELRHGDCRDVIRAMSDNSIDSVVTDPPYALVSIQKRFGKPGSAPTKDGDVYARASAGFMGKQWDTGETAFAAEFWAEVLRVLKPGGYVVAFSGTRTYHRMAVAIEDAGFEIRDQLGWAYFSGFPKSHNVGKAIDKHLGVEREKVRITNVRNPKATGGGKDGADGATRPWIEAALERGYHEKDGDNPATPQPAAWDGWGTSLKPSWEPICLARKPLAGTVAENVLAHGVGGLNIDGCRVGDFVNTTPPGTDRYNRANFEQGYRPSTYGREGEASAERRYTERGSTNFAATPGPRGGAPEGRWPANIIHDCSPETLAACGLAADNVTRLYFSPKADKSDRMGSKHPTVKPVDLMQWLVRMVTPKGGLVLDPFAGSGSTGEAAWREGMRCILIEREEEYQADIAERLRLADAGPMERKARAIKQAANDNLPLFGGAETGGAR